MAKNRDNKSVQYAHADDVRIFEFLEQIFSLKRNNPVFPFNFASDIVTGLREQFAGLFQDLLSKRSSAPAGEIVNQLKQLAASLENLVKSIAQGNADKTQVIEQLLLTNHPVYSRLKSHTNTPCRIFFTSIAELDSWLSARMWKKTEDTFGLDESHVWQFERKNGDTLQLSVSASLFDERGNLKLMSEKDWDESLVELHTIRRDQRPTKQSLDDEIPF